MFRGSISIFCLIIENGNTNQNCYFLQKRCRHNFIHPKVCILRRKNNNRFPPFQVWRKEQQILLFLPRFLAFYWVSRLQIYCHFTHYCQGFQAYCFSRSATCNSYSLTFWSNSCNLFFPSLLWFVSSMKQTSRKEGMQSALLKKATPRQNSLYK